jgi:nucleoside-triphosphatase THEP1
MTDRPAVRILHGPVGSGKTSRALVWIAGRRPDEVGGVVTLKTETGRVMRDLETGALMPMEGAAGDAPVATVGPFRFRVAAFDWAGAVLMRAAETRPFVVVDEVGPLELRGEGLAPALTVLMASRATPVLIVRTPLVAAVVARFCAGRVVEADPS